jgi:hypothetical protein
MTEAKFATLALTAALLSANGAGAQVASNVEAGALVTNPDGTLPYNNFRVAPGIKYKNPLFALSAQGSAWLVGQQWQVADGIVSGTFTSPTVYGVRAELLTNASRAFADQALGTDQVDVQTRIHVLFKQRGGIWLGGGIARPWRVAVVSSVDVTGGGGWTRLGDATLSGTFTNFSFTKLSSQDDTSGSSLGCASSNVVPLTTRSLMPVPVLANESSLSENCSRQSRFSDLEGSIHWEHGSFEINAQAGYRFGPGSVVDAESRRWSAGTATMWINDRVAFVAGGGRQPANVARGIPARGYGTIGLMLAAWPMPKASVAVAPVRATLIRSFDVRPSANGMQKFIVRIGGVETVDVMGDFSDWSPLTLIRHGRDLWELSIPLSAGRHQINVRVDGGPWIAPPGVPTMRDGFNGEVGVVVISPDK